MVDEWSLKDSEELEDVFRLLKNLEEFIWTSFDSLVGFFRFIHLLFYFIIDV